tara:strand:+ start:119 stop:397 length:279 start_codon:yes stop_codon:yes gene_type:complete
VLLIVLVKPIKYSAIFEVESSMPLSKPVFPEAFVDVAVFLPDILAVAVSDIVGPSTDIDFLVFDECLLADAMFYVFDLLTFVNGVAFFTIYF